MSSKKIISYEELLEKLNGILASYGECRNIHIDSVEVYPEQIDGANWHVTRYRCSGSDHDLPDCREKIVGEIRILRKAYDVEVSS